VPGAAGAARHGVAIIGATSPEHVDAAVAAPSLRLMQEEVRELEAPHLLGRRT
jgi:aryl-alcohol dehydrogenase-like predicted oxidoreductase